MTGPYLSIKQTWENAYCLLVFCLSIVRKSTFISFEFQIVRVTPISALFVNDIIDFGHPLRFKLDSNSIVLFWHKFIHSPHSSATS